MKILFDCKSTAWLPLLAAAAGLLSACGQYGDLYLPENAGNQQPQQQQADEPQDKDKPQQQPQDW